MQSRGEIDRETGTCKKYAICSVIQVCAIAWDGQNEESVHFKVSIRKQYQGQLHAVGHP